MSGLVLSGIMLILLVSFCISAYVTFHNFSIRNFYVKLVVFIFLGVIISVVAFTASLTVY